MGQTQRAASSTVPANAGRVLLALILVAAVANLNLAVANVALPSIGKAFDSSQTDARPHRGRLLARPGGVGALPRRARRPLRPQADADPRHGAVDPRVPARRVRADRHGPVRRRALLGGLAAGMAYPTTLALITALWSGPARTKSIALWSALGGAISALGPLLVRAPARALLVGLGVPGHAAARRGRARAWRASSCPRTSTRRPSRSTTSAASSRSLLVGRVDPRASTSRPVPNEGTLVARPRASIALAAGRRVRHPPAPRREPALRPPRRRAPRLLGRGVRRASSCSAR